MWKFREDSIPEKTKKTGKSVISFGISVLKYGRDMEVVAVKHIEKEFKEMQWNGEILECGIFMIK